MIGKTIKSIHKANIKDNEGHVFSESITVITFTDDSITYVLAYLDGFDGKSINEYPTEVRFYDTIELLLKDFDSLGYVDTSNFKLI